MSTPVVKVSVPAAVPTPRAAVWLGAVLDAVREARESRTGGQSRAVVRPKPVASAGSAAQTSHYAALQGPRLLELAGDIQGERPDLAAELRLVARHRGESLQAPKPASLASRPMA